MIRRSTREDGRIRETRERGRENRKRGLRVEEEDGEGTDGEIGIITS